MSQEELKNILQNAKRIVVKVGSAVLTNSDGLDYAVLNSLVEQLAYIRDLNTKEQKRSIILVSSGAVAAGRAVLRKYNNESHSPSTSLAAKQAAAAVGQSRLMQAYDMAFASHGIGTAQILLTRDDLRSRQRFLNAKNTFAELLNWGIIPVINENDTVSVQELKFGDNDCLASLLVNLIEADIFINLTSANGVLDDNPQKNPNAKIMPCIENVNSLDLNSLCGAKTSVGSGGMYSKLLAAQRVAQLGVPMLIVPGREKNILSRFFDNDNVENIGTWVKPLNESISRRKFWLAYQSEPVGKIYIDDGASLALSQKGSSLLPVGINGVEGNFQGGSLVSIISNSTKNSLGVGLSNYPSNTLKKIMGLKNKDLINILGNAHYEEAIHRDNLLIDAAL